MTVEKTEEGCIEEDVACVAVVEQATVDGQPKAVEKKLLRGVVLCCGEADEQLKEEYKAIITAVIGKAKKGDLASIKLLLELADRAGRAEEISDEEIESLGYMLMREFLALQEENGSSEETNG